MSRRAKTYPVEAVIDLPAGLLLGPEFLGLLKPALIGGVEVHVALPNFRKSDHETVLHRRAKMNWVGWFAGKPSEDDPGAPFGRIVAWQGSEVLQVVITRMLVLPKSKLTRRQARRLHDAIDDWVRCLETWIEVVAGEDLHIERVRLDHPGQTASVLLRRGPDGKGEFIKAESQITVNFGGHLAISPRQWGGVLIKASEGEKPPEAHVLLRDARHARNSGRYRRSVLDSATATEVALAKLRDDELASTGSGIAKYTRAKAQQIGGLAEFLSAMGRSLPKRIQQEVGEPRNRAIHEGHELDQETATKALAKAEEVVDLAFPRKKLL